MRQIFTSVNDFIFSMIACTPKILTTVFFVMKSFLSLFTFLLLQGTTQSGGLDKIGQRLKADC